MEDTRTTLAIAGALVVGAVAVRLASFVRSARNTTNPFQYSPEYLDAKAKSDASGARLNAAIRAAGGKVPTEPTV